MTLVFTRLALAIGGASLAIEGRFTLPDVQALVDRWFDALTLGATPDEQAALAARLTADADTLRHANAALSALGRDASSTPSSEGAAHARQP